RGSARDQFNPAVVFPSAQVDEEAILLEGSRVLGHVGAHVVVPPQTVVPAGEHVTQDNLPEKWKPYQHWTAAFAVDRTQPLEIAHPSLLAEVQEDLSLSGNTRTNATRIAELT